MKKLFKKGVTMLELIVVVLIIAILSSIAVTVYTGQVERAKRAACRDIIRQLELAVSRYEVDTGQFPLSSSGTLIAPSGTNPQVDSNGNSLGSGYLQVCLRASLNGNVFSPLDSRWQGPYISFDDDKLGDINGNSVTSGMTKAEVQLLDPWGKPFYYTRWQDYPSMGGAERPVGDPFRSPETYYNPRTFQIFSKGPDGITIETPGGKRGTESDDVNNWTSK